MHRVLAVVIALLIAGAVSAAIVKGGGTNPVVISTPTPTQTYTYDGLPPTLSPTETPIIPASEPAASPTEKQLARTGARSMTGAALLTIGLALASGVAVRRTAGRP